MDLPNPNCLEVEPGSPLGECGTKEFPEHVHRRLAQEQSLFDIEVMHNTKGVLAER